MKKGIVLYLLLSIIVIGCSSNKQAHEESTFIDVSKEYPEKGIDLADIADVTCVHLISKSDDY